MLEMFKDRIDWAVLSAEANAKTCNINNLEKFKDYWNWHELSGNSNVNMTEEMLDKFIDLWDWYQLLDRWYGDEDNISLKLIYKYIDRIPMDRLFESNLWSNCLAEKRKSELESELE